MIRLKPDLVAYIGLTLIVLISIADQIAPYRGAAGACVLGYVIDGDTVVMTCDGLSETARLLGFDAPEVHGACPAEVALAERATARLRSLTASPDLAVYPKGLDKYRRRLVVMTQGGRDIAEIMVAEGLAVPYAGDKRRDWCGR